MYTVAVLNPKGGSGKTTLATNLALGLEDAGDSVLLVDTDPKGPRGTGKQPTRIIRLL